MTLTLIFTVIILLFFFGKALSELKTANAERDKRLDAHDKMLAKHTKQIAKHEEEIIKLKRIVKRCNKEIEYLTDFVAEKDALIDYWMAKQEGTTPDSKEYVAYTNKIRALKNQIHGAEKKINKAHDDRKDAERKLCA